MTIEFSPSCDIPANQRGELQLWIKNTVEKGSYFYFAAVREAGCYVMMTANWHTHNQQEYLTGDVFIENDRLGTAHVYRNGQVTMNH